MCSLLSTLRFNAALILFPLAIFAAISTVLAPGVCASASAADEPAELREARARYEKDIELAIRPLKERYAQALEKIKTLEKDVEVASEVATRPLRERYVQSLEKIKKSLTMKGDLAGALKVQDEMESLGLGQGLARLAGDWAFQYTNGAVHHYTIEADGAVFWTDPSPKKKLKTAMRGKVFIFEFPDDNILERITVSGNELQIDHYTPKSNYPQGAPATRGSGKRIVQKK
jgi:hypothetical protein